MSIDNTLAAQADFDTYDHQTSYIFTPSSNHEAAPLRPRKRRKISKQHEEAQNLSTEHNQLKFPPLFNGAENPTLVDLRQQLFEESWGYTDAKIQSILREANENTLSKLTSFIDEAASTEHRDQVPAGLIITGPNIASQDLLFGQIAESLRLNAQRTVIILRSGDATNLKAVLKKLIRDATNQKEDESEDAQIAQKGGRKLLNYDLQVLYEHLKSSTNSKIIVGFQDSEGFDSGLLAELLVLFSSWLDRIPFIVLFGIATSVELFHERLPRAATRCLQGAQFDVEQASITLENVFRQAVGGCESPLLLGSGFVTALIERQHDHVQSLQTFANAVKYAYMTHFFANPLSVFLSRPENVGKVIEAIQPEHIEAIRMLPSFRGKIEFLLAESKPQEARELLESGEVLLSKVRSALEKKHAFIIKLQRKIHILAASVSGENRLVDRINIYIKAVSGQLGGSEIVQDFLGSIISLTPDETISLAKRIANAIMSGDPSEGLPGWGKPAPLFLKELERIQSVITRLVRDADTAGTPLRSRYTSQSKILRTTVVAQKVQLSKEKSSLSKLDESYSDLLDELSELLQDYFTFEDPQDQFLHEIWLYDSKSPYREVFTPKPRYAIERALSVPHDYLGCTCCKASEGGLSASQPPTSILYQLYLETGGLINVFDLWSAFNTIMGGEDGEDGDERSTLALFYRALADLKILGLVKQSKKKTDHLAKLAWKGL